jgi:hypothetical protein
VGRQPLALQFRVIPNSAQRQLRTTNHCNARVTVRYFFRDVIKTGLGHACYPASCSLSLSLPLPPSPSDPLTLLRWLTSSFTTCYMRSILKHPRLSDLHYQQHGLEPFPFATCASVQVSAHVHFPPTPTLTSTFITHSSSVYDRTPAEVAPNTCALPGRHEREFVDASYPRRPRRMWDWDREGSQGSYFQPRGSEGRSIEPSESDDSDVVRTPPEPALPCHPISVRFGYRETNDAMLPYSPSQQEIESALSFLPHAPSIPMKTKKGTRRSHSLGRSQPKEPRRETADGWIHHHTDFVVPNLDFEGCLGGF